MLLKLLYLGGWKGVYFSHRVRVILLPVVPKPSFSSYDIQVSKSSTDGVISVWSPPSRLKCCLLCQRIGFRTPKAWIKVSNPTTTSAPAQSVSTAPSPSQTDWTRPTGPVWPPQSSFPPQSEEFLMKDGSQSNRFIYTVYIYFSTTILNKDHDRRLLFKKFSQVIFLYMLLLCFLYFLFFSKTVFKYLYFCEIEKMYSGRTCCKGQKIMSWSKKKKNLLSMINP